MQLLIFKGKIYKTVKYSNKRKQLRMNEDAFSIMTAPFLMCNKKEKDITQAVLLLDFVFQNIVNVDKGQLSPLTFAS